MEFEPFEHARFLGDAWANGPPRVNLGSSGLQVDWQEYPPGDVEDLTGLHLHAGTSLRDRLADRFGLPHEQLHVTAGTTGANLACLLSAVRPGCNVVVERPTYLPLVSLAKGLGATVSWVDREPDWTLDAEKVVAAIGQDTTAVLLTSPNNPTGQALSESDLLTIAQKAHQVGAVVIVDEVYRELTGRKPAALVHEACISTAGFNKCWGAGGIRIGWMAGAQVQARSLGDVALQSSLAPSGHGQRAAHWLLDREAECRARLEQHLAASHAAVAAWQNKTGRPIHVGQLTAWMPVEDDLATANALVKQGILTVPGRFFGTPNFVRLGLGIPAPELAAGLDALDAALPTQRS